MTFQPLFSFPSPRIAGSIAGCPAQWEAILSREPRTRRAGSLDERRLSNEFVAAVRGLAAPPTRVQALRQR
jgi:hypothetical protein